MKTQAKPEPQTPKDRSVLSNRCNKSAASSLLLVAADFVHESQPNHAADAFISKLMPKIHRTEGKKTMARETSKSKHDKAMEQAQ